MKPWTGLLLAAFVLLGGCADPPASATAQDAHDDGAPAPQAQPTTSPQTSQTNQTTPPSNATTVPPTPAPPPSPANATPAEPPGPKPVWGEPNTADIYPGIMLDSGCTTNFLFTSLDNRHIYLGGASHCFIVGGGSSIDTRGYDECDPNGPDVPMAPGEPVYFMNDRATYLNQWMGTPAEDMRLDIVGTLAYNSLHAMQENHEEIGSSACGGNDFALVEIPLEAQGRITPHFRTWGPAKGIATPDSIRLLDPVIAYGHSPYWMGLEPLHPKRGHVTNTQNGEWGFSGTTFTPGFFGDSGSAVMDGKNHALGVLLGWGDGTWSAVFLSKTLAYMQEHTPLRVKLAEP